jgi:uncharacterized metal-binding protein YceD (DUF177 family)
MRLALAQLRKLRFPYVVEEDLDLSEDLIGYEDILDCSKAHVKYEFTLLDTDKYLIRMNINIDLVLESAISMKHINKSIEAVSDEIYMQNPDFESDINPIENQTLDTKEAVITDILCEKPMRSIIDGEEFESDDVESSEEDSQKVNPAFASLADLLKK